MIDFDVDYKQGL